MCIRSNPIFEKIRKAFPTAELICGLPDVSKLNLDLDTTPKCIILDDLMNDLLDSAEIVKLVSIQTHHSNITVIYTLHNFFANSKHGKTISRNLQYSVIFFNRLDLRELKIISCQIGNNANFLFECFTYLMKKYPNDSPYILIDGHFKSKMKDMHVRTRIFPVNNEIKPMIFFQT